MEINLMRDKKEFYCKLIKANLEESIKKRVN